TNKSPVLDDKIVLQVNGKELINTVDTKYHTVDAVADELPRPLVIAPPVFSNLANNVLVFPTNQPKPLSVRVTAATGPVKGELKMAVPKGWEVNPASLHIDLKAADAETVATF